MATLIVRFKGFKSSYPVWVHGKFTLAKDYAVSFITLDGAYRLEDDSGRSVWENQDSFNVIYIRKDNEAI